MNRILKLSYFFVILLLIKEKSYAVPTSFLKSQSGNMRDEKWNKLESETFDIYYPEKSINMANYALISAQNSYPYLSLLLGSRVKGDTFPLFPSQINRTIISRFDRIPYILGNKTESAGFANPVSLNIEAQMIHSRTAAFFQHELVHRLMYEHNDFNIGPAGRIFSLAMFPTWWIEGLAEYLTESIGENETESLTREMALNNYWPSWDRLHALYNADGDTNSRGYVTSGRFLGWIFSKAKEKDLYKIHEQISKKTITPPFYNASDIWLYNNLGKNGEELYEEFQIEQKKYWHEYLNEMPSLFKAETWDKKDSGQKYTYPTFVFNNKAIFSKMVASASSYHSALYFKDFSLNKEIRLPIQNAGSSLFDISNDIDGVILTANLKKFANASIGHELIALSFKGNIENISEENIINEKIINFAKKDEPLVIDQIQYAGNSIFFVAASLNGNSRVYLVNAKAGEVKILSQYPYPASLKLIKSLVPSNNLMCINLILDNDLKNNSIEKICENGEKTEVVRAKSIFIKDAYILKDGSIRILTNWDKTLALVDYTPPKKITPIVAFPDLIEGIIPWNKNSNQYIGTWAYKEGKFHLKKIDLNKAQENFIQWQKVQENNSKFLYFPDLKKYTPPFMKIYNDQKQTLLKEDLNIFEKKLDDYKEKQLNIEDSNIITHKGPASNKSQATNLPADYRNNFLFAYPYAVPDFLGGPSIGLFAIPLTDEMERYRIQVFGGYNFYLNSPSGSLSYINNRFLDNFSVSLFSTPFFNGYYDISQPTSSGTETYRYYNYLQQSGVSLSGTWQFRPSTFLLQSTFSVARLNPYSTLNTPPQRVGPQNATIASLTSLLSFNAFHTAVYLANEKKTNGEWLVWKTDMSLGTGKFNSLGNSTDSLGQNSGEIDYYNANATLLSNISFYKQNFSVLGKLSTTQGPGTLNIKEIYSPFQNYILGNTSSLNYVSYPIIGSGSLFTLRSGYWSYSGTLSYDFPIYPSFEKKFLMSFVENWRGVVSLNRGGVSNKTNFSTYDSVTSASIGTSVTVDIKGFQLFPSLLYGWVVGQNGWYVLMQVRFMDIL